LRARHGNIRDLIRRGAPANGDEARQIIRIAMQNMTDPADDWRKRLSAALTEIMIGRQLHAETYKARADALAVIDEIDKRTRGKG
jgi:type III secretion system FlhB-like substrate exporter